jgi:hypothetical protein
MSLILFDAFSGRLLAHAFDTGLPLPQRTTIRDGIAARLAPLLKSNGGYLAAIVQLPAMMRDSRNDEDRDTMFRALNGRTPAIGIALGRRRTEASGTLATEARGVIDVGIYFASQHSRDLVSGRMAPDVVARANLVADPGIEVMLEHVEQLLLGHSLEDEDGDALATIGELRATDEDEAGTADDLTVWEQKYEIAVERVINPARDVTQLLLSIQGDHTEAGMAAVTPGTHELAPLTTIATISPEGP